jgi:hypothetical protein
MTDSELRVVEEKGKSPLDMDPGAGCCPSEGCDHFMVPATKLEDHFQRMHKDRELAPEEKRHLGDRFMSALVFQRYLPRLVKGTYAVFSWSWSPAKASVL